MFIHRNRVYFLYGSLIVITGCSATPSLPVGLIPAGANQADTILPASFQTSRPPAPAAKADGKVFELPPGLTLEMEGNVPKDNLPPAEHTERLSGDTLTLAQLQELAVRNSPQLQQAQVQIEAFAGAMQQEGLYPNPVVGYQSDQMQPWALPTGTPGQQGAFISQLIKTAGKLELSQQVAGYDYLNSIVEARRVQVDLIRQVRTHYFACLVALQAVEINRSLVNLADEVYQLQKKQVRAGEAAAYEPQPLFAQAVQARNALKLAEANLQANWRQLASAMGTPEMSWRPLAGRADVKPPVWKYEDLKQRLMEEHTEVLAARNRQLQAETQLRLQQVVPIPDLQTNLIVQYDNVIRTTQFGMQLGISLPIYDRNQGNIRQAQAQLTHTQLALPNVQNQLIARLAEAYGRFEAAQVLARNHAELIIPQLTSAYQTMIRRYQIEPDKVQFNDIVVAQQNVAMAYQTYLQALDNQWKAIVDLANIAQLDELFPD
ncbi:MAG TPA: TolC family protein [Gemmatales bacterium]|nr:TolC family protein [Gemmatales bacterium]